MNKSEIISICKDEQIKFIRLQFTDIMGINKNVEIPFSQIERALNNEIMFDGSSIEGFSRIEESDMVLKPDLETFIVFPFENIEGKSKVARLICDIITPNGNAFEGCPRSTLKKVCKEAEEMGFTLFAGPEVEFFLFTRTKEGAPSVVTHDKASYFDLAPIDKGEEARRAIIEILENIGFEVEAAHHEVAEGQHEIDFRYAQAVKTADNITTFKFIVRKVAAMYDLHATFMPKPIFGIQGSGMHVHQSLFKDGNNAFYDAKSSNTLSKTALQYIAGLLKHAKSYCAVTNPLINSYKRLVPGYEAPINIAWSEKNRSPLVRVPAVRGESTRVEVRLPDPSANPYLALAVMLKSGLDGIKNKMVPPPSVNKNIYEMSDREKGRLKIDELPANLLQAVKNLSKDKVVLDALGKHIADHFIEAKEAEWNNYISQIHQWEIDKYLGYY